MRSFSVIALDEPASAVRPGVENRTLSQPVTALPRLDSIGNATANLVSDAHLAALSVEHNCKLASTDTDFARFRGLKWRNPITNK